MTGATAAHPATFTPKALADAFAFATEWLAVHVEEVNALNVYPVPDGDTGTNMHLTMQSVRRQLTEADGNDMKSVAHAISYGSLLGARGNSGVILSQILKGFATSISAQRAVDASALRHALLEATKTAYAAVLKPVEGTILTVCRALSEHAEGVSASASPLDLLRSACRAGHEALAKTPEQLPILRQAGVVDAGGLGLLRVLEGIVAHFDDAELPPPPVIERRAQTNFEEEAFGFCTEFLLSGVEVDTREIQEAVQPFGDSLLVVGAEGFVKGHIHTEEPERLLALVSRYGKMVRSKVEDMSEQHSEILAAVDAADAVPPTLGLVSVSDGYGVTQSFRSLGVRVVGGGQTNNPSVQDIVDAVRSVGAPTVIVMPNNPNVRMAAERVADLVNDQRVLVLPTRTLGQGLAGAVAFQEDGDPDDVYAAMEAAIDDARTLEVTTASRDASIDGVTVREGQYIGLVDGRLTEAGDSADDVLARMVDAAIGDAEVATLFHSSVIDDSQAEALAARLSDAHEDLDVSVHAGAPELYPYLLVLE